ncbi:endonuclease/exonuclease/phosphatase family protein [Nocardioides sp. KR10-350]|uniref:endonuclease/exonuclease/phosphatase family protein n=1 Tax=Nocardioides cheoyonin TaxID=3156615 RepID=UPI0032B55DCF
MSRVGAVVAWVVGVVLGVPAVAITLARLSGATWKPAVVLQAAAPLALLAYAGVLLLLVAVRLAAGRRRWLPLAAVLAVAGLALHAWWEAPLLTGSTPEAAPGGARLTVMTSNIELGGGDVAAVARQARERHADVLAVEEVTPGALRRLEATGLLDELRYRAGEPGSGVHGTMVFSRTPLTDVRRIPTRMGSWAFTVRGWRVVAVHPSSPETDHWAADQGVLRDAAAREHPDVMLGDFNATLDHRPFRQILGTGLEDAARLTNAGWQPTWPVGGFGGFPLPPYAAIDHVLLGHDVTAISTATVTIPDTDHKALVAVLAAR